MLQIDFIMRTKSGELKNKIKACLTRAEAKGAPPPSYREMSAELGVNASTVYRYLLDMARDGELYRGEFGYETPSMHGDEREYVSVAVLGAVPCGPLTEVYQDAEGFLRLPRSFVGRGEHYLLRASGSSMVKAGIDDGDLVLIRMQSEAADGDIVVALVDNEVTLKRLYRGDGRIILHPENDTMSDISVRSCEIQGVAVKVIKDL